MFSPKIYKIFKNTLVVASESLRNDFADQMFTLQLSKILPRTILKKKKKLPSSYREKNDALKERCAGNEVGKKKSSCIHLIYFYLYSVATGMANIPQIFSLVMFY